MYILTYSFVDRVTLQTVKGVRVFGEDDFKAVSSYYEHFALLSYYNHVCLWHNPRLSFSDIVEGAEIIKAEDFNGKGGKDL